MSQIAAGTNPSFLFLHYELGWRFANLFAVPKHIFHPGLIQPRKSLPPEHPRAQATSSAASNLTASHPKPASTSSNTEHGAPKPTSNKNGRPSPPSESPTRCAAGPSTSTTRSDNSQPNSASRRDRCRKNGITTRRRRLGYERVSEPESREKDAIKPALEIHHSYKGKGDWKKYLRG